jgi:hypothetical protein
MLALAGIAAIFCRCRDDPAAANPAIPLLTLRWSALWMKACALVEFWHVQAHSCARLRPSPVLARISSRSNSAKPPRTVSISLPCGVVVSAQASLSRAIEIWHETVERTQPEAADRK